MNRRGFLAAIAAFVAGLFVKKTPPAFEAYYFPRPGSLVVSQDGFVGIVTANDGTEVIYETNTGWIMWERNGKYIDLGPSSDIRPGQYMTTYPHRLDESENGYECWEKLTAHAPIVLCRPTERVKKGESVSSWDGGIGVCVPPGSLFSGVSMPWRDKEERFIGVASADCEPGELLWLL